MSFLFFICFNFFEKKTFFVFFVFFVFSGFSWVFLFFMGFQVFFVIFLCVNLMFLPYSVISPSSAPCLRLYRR